jgi:lipopolysaccharide export system protein LptC
VRLFGNAVVTREPWRGAAEMVAKSNYLQAWPDREVVETDQPIEIVRGGSRVNANAMQYDNATQKIYFDGGKGGRVREVLEPRAARGRVPPSTDGK